jgi:hypothetical protein
MIVDESEATFAKVDHVEAQYKDYRADEELLTSGSFRCYRRREVRDQMRRRGIGGWRIMMLEEICVQGMVSLVFCKCSVWLR